VACGAGACEAGPRANKTSKGPLVETAELHPRWSVRSVTDHHVFVVCRDDRFYYTAPEEVRHQGPWRVMLRRSSPSSVTLRTARVCSAARSRRSSRSYSLPFARDGYALVKCVLAVFKPEA
jgi:hypothetical protein